MKKRFSGSGFGPVGYLLFFMLFTFGFFSSGHYFIGLFIGLLFIMSLLLFAYNFQVYVITDDEFYVCNLYGIKFNSMPFADMDKIYYSKGTQTIYSLAGRSGDGDSYEVDILKIRMKNGEIFKLNLDDVWNYIPLLELLEKKHNEQMCSPADNDRIPQSN